MLIDDSCLTMQNKRQNWIKKPDRHSSSSGFFCNFESLVSGGAYKKCVVPILAWCDKDMAMWNARQEIIIIMKATDYEKDIFLIKTITSLLDIVIYLFIQSAAATHSTGIKNKNTSEWQFLNQV